MGEIATPSALIFPEKRNMFCGMSVLENVVFDEHDHDVGHIDKSVRENTRGSYPIEYIPIARIPCASSQPNNVILLPCDAPTCEQTEPDTYYVRFQQRLHCPGAIQTDDVNVCNLV
ncbi:phosphoenolpyruvate carboxykinase (ATP) [Ranunculus cassubicifolius]